MDNLYWLLLIVSLVCSILAIFARSQFGKNLFDGIADAISNFFIVDAILSLFKKDD